MDELRGKFISVVCKLLETKPEVKAAVLDYVLKQTGKPCDQIDSEGWYPVEVFAGACRVVEEKTTPILARAALKAMGTKIYPAIKATVGLPPHLKTPSDFLRFEAEGYLVSYRGPSVHPREVIKDEPNAYSLQADMPQGVPIPLMEGVFLGILQIAGVYNGSVRVEEKNGHVYYHITWPRQA